MTFRVVTYNIHKCQGLDGRVRVERIGEVLAGLRADIIALQEVVSDTEKGAEHHQAEFLAKWLDCEMVMGEARKHGGALYGNATLIRHGIRESRVLDVSIPGREPRTILRTDVVIAGELLHVFNIHLGTGWGERRLQAARLLTDDILRAKDVGGLRLVVGDFNEWTLGEATRVLRQEFGHCQMQRGWRMRRYPAAMPLLHLDHIYYDGGLKVERAFFETTRLSLVASDHLPLVADFTYQPSLR